MERTRVAHACVFVCSVWVLAYAFALTLCLSVTHISFIYASERLKVEISVQYVQTISIKRGCGVS